MLNSQLSYETDDRATVRLAKSFEPNGWLKAVKLNENDLTSYNMKSSWNENYALNRAFTVPVAKLPKVEGFISEQEYEGLVTTLNPDERSFWARLVDVSGGTPDEEVEFEFKEIPSDDWPLIVPGALFSWNIGLETRNRQARRVTEIRFRRFFQFSKASIAKAEQEAEDLQKLIKESSYSE